MKTIYSIKHHGHLYELRERYVPPGLPGEIQPKPVSVVLRDGVEWTDARYCGQFNSGKYPTMEQFKACMLGEEVRLFRLSDTSSREGGLQ